MLRLRTLGSPIVEESGGLSPGTAAGQRKAVALLVLLAAGNQRGVSRDRLLGFLWPEVAPKKAAHRLNQLLYALRRDLGSDVLFLGSSDLRLNPEVMATDLADFATALRQGELEQAVALYGGPFLDGFYLDGAPDFERWTEDERMRLAKRYGNALETLASHGTERGDLAAAVEWRRKLAQVDPLDSRATLRLIEALYVAGDAAGALQAARAHQALLRKELDAPPDPDITSLAELIRSRSQSVVSTPVVRPLADPFENVAAFSRALMTPGRISTRISMASAASPDSIVVLPFANLSSNPEHDYFTDGITADIITRLANISALHVISRASSIRYKGSTKSLRDIAADFCVGSVLEGTVRLAGNRIRITAQLIDARTDQHLWAETFDRNVSDVFTVQAEVAESIAKALGAHLSRAERAAVKRDLTHDLEAYNLCLLGRHFWNRWNEEDIRKSTEYFERAIARDPAYAQAHYGLGIAWAMLALGYFRFRPLDVYPTARGAIMRALELDPQMGEAEAWLAALDYEFEFDWDGAEARFQHALAIDSHNGTVHELYGCFLTAVGRHAQARAHYERACAFDPLSTSVIANAGLGAYRARDHNRAIELFKRVVSLDPNLPVGHTLLALAYLQQSRLDEALLESREGLRLGSSASTWRAVHAYVCAASREGAEARQILLSLEAHRGIENTWLVMIAMAYAKLGETDLAFTRLEEACQERGGWTVWLSVEPGLDDLRTDPRFPALVASLGLPSS
jgi:TolB-like protein/DNA-binding SARP family transcriptional activator/cytochrome c-type biogenesis protein CcmH/NrfG